jgi:hypothetical protein
VRCKTVKTVPLFIWFQNRKYGLSSETTRNLLICFLWIIKNVDKSVLKQWWTELPSQRLHQLLELLNICISCFEYKVGFVQVIPSSVEFSVIVYVRGRYCICIYIFFFLFIKTILDLFITTGVRTSGPTNCIYLLELGLLLR